MTPLRHPLHELLAHYRSCREPGAKVLELFAAIDLLFRVDALVMCAAFFRDHACSDSKVTRALALPTLGVGAWLNLLETLLGITSDHRGDALRTWVKRQQSAERFSRLIAFRNAYSHGHGSRRPDYLAQVVARVEPDLFRCVDEHPEIGEFRALDDRVELVLTGDVLDCYPLMLRGTSDDVAESVLCYSRRDEEAARLHYFHSIAGEQPVARGHEGYRHLLARLAEKAVLTPEALARKASKDPDQAAALQRCFTRCTQETLRRLRARNVHRPELFIDRLEPSAAFEAFLASDARLLVVVGPEGSGRSALLCAIAEARCDRGATILFESADQLPDGPFPDLFGAPLGIPSGLTGKLHHVRVASHDDRVLIAVDDLSATKAKTDLLRSIVRWTKQLQESSPVRVIVSVQSAQFALLQERLGPLLEGKLVNVLHLPRLSAHEVRQLAERFGGADCSPALRELRRKLAARILEREEDASRRPGVLLRLLERAQPGDEVANPISPCALLAERLRAACDSQGPYGRTLRRPLALRLAEVMVVRRSLRIPVDDAELLTGRLFYGDDNRSTADYCALVAHGVLVESEAEGRTVVGFSSLSLFAFVAAQSYPLTASQAALAKLCGCADTFEAASDIAAQLVVRLGLSGGDLSEVSALALPSAAKTRLVRAVADLDRPSFLRLLSHLLPADPAWALDVLEAVLWDGQPRTALLGLELLIAHETCDSALARRAHLLAAHAHWDVDDYEATERELAAIHERDLMVDKIHAMISTARGDFATACTRFEALVATVGQDSLARAELLMRMVPALLGSGACTEAEANAREALALLQAHGDGKNLAESYGNLGQALAAQQRFSEAAACYAQSLVINQRAGVLVGRGVVHGLTGDLLMRTGQLQEAALELARGLDIARCVDNRWREAWILRRLGELAALEGALELATEHARAASELYAAIGCLPQ